MPHEPVVYSLRDFDVVVDNQRDDISTDAVLQRLYDALGLIEQYQPWRLKHLREDLRYFLVIRYPCRGRTSPPSGPA